MLEKIAKACVAEVDAGGLKGKKADDFAFAFMVGAMQACQLLADERGIDRGIKNPDMVMMLVGTRGYKAVVDLAKPRTKST